MGKPVSGIVVVPRLNSGEDGLIVEKWQRSPLFPDFLTRLLPTP
ncbi:hypothetical protein [Paenibacillus sp. 22594]